MIRSILTRKKLSTNIEKYSITDYLYFHSSISIFNTYITVFFVSSKISEQISATFTISIVIGVNML